MDAAELVGRTDESMLFLLEMRAAAESGEARGQAARVAAALAALRQRRLPKRVAEVVAADLDGRSVGHWLIFDTPFKKRVEDRLARELGLEVGRVFLDYPEKLPMFALDLLVQRQSGEVVRVGPGGRAGLIGLPRIADELYRTARVLRLFALGGRPKIEPASLAHLATLDEAEMTRRLERDSPLLS
jgi:hypothetical protein